MQKSILTIIVSWLLLFCSAEIKAASPADAGTDTVPTKITELQEVVAVRKEKYRKKGNPAVALIEKIRKASQGSDPRNEEQYSYDEYNKLVLGIHDYKKPAGEGNPLSDFIDTAALTGKPVLNLSLKERGAKRIWSDNGKKEKTIVVAKRSEGIDESLDQGNIQKLLDDVLRQVDIYGNDITIMQNRFVSPLSRIATDYYKFYLVDTIAGDDGNRYIRIAFGPHNRESMGFSGNLYVQEGDSGCFIRNIDMRVPKTINLNYVKELRIEQEFSKDAYGNRHKIHDNMTVVLQVLPSTPQIYARRETTSSNQRYYIDKEYAGFLDKDGYEHTLPEAGSRSEIDWVLIRYGNMSMAQRSMHQLMPNLRKNSLFYWGERIVSCLVRGYISPVKNSGVVFGPLNTLVSFNDIEGARFRVGGMTTAYLSKRWFGRAYVAYGTKDRRFKYGAELEYSFLDKEYHSREFPIKSLRLSHYYDIDQIGQHYLFTNKDNIFLSLKRMSDERATYRRLTALEYTLELRNGFSLEAALRHERQEATASLPFILADGRCIEHYNQSTLSIRLRYAPGETFYQSASQRLPINMDAPVFMITHEFGPKGTFGSSFTLNKTEISFQKRFWFSASGYLDAVIRGAKIWSKVYYPALTWANANLSYTIQPESFSLMRPLEFATDQYFSWDLTYWMNGLIFNRIPFVKKAKLREVISFKGYYGSLTDKNNPLLDKNLPQFPQNAGIGLMRKMPYMELSAGLDNIFTILRVDWVWRLSYLKCRDRDKYGLRISLHFSF